MAGRRARRKAAQAKAGTAVAPVSPAPPPAAPASVRGRQTLRDQRVLQRAHPNSGDPLIRARIKHLERVAAWASATVPPLGGLLGARLAATCEAAGLAPSPATQKSTCERCESFLLQPEINCSVQVAKTRKGRHKSPGGMGKSSPFLKSSVYLLHKCQYCQHGNKKPFTPSAKRARITSSTGKAREELGTDKIRADDAEGSSTPAEEPPHNNHGQVAFRQMVASGTSTPSPSIGNKKRKRKGWMTLKEITSQEQARGRASPALPSPLDALGRSRLQSLSNQMLCQLYSPG